MLTYILAAQHGLGHHTDTIEKKDYYEYLKMTFIQAIVSTIGGMAFLKLSVAFCLLRLRPPPLYTRTLWSLIGKPLGCDSQRNWVPLKIAILNIL